MLADHTQLASKQYKVEPVPKDLIASTGEKKANILWVGCSDSWITETSALDVLPEETFVHRNLGNVMSNGDLSSQSAISYSIDFLQVNHIVVCGHYDCGLIKAASEQPNAIDGWYEDLSKLRAAYLDLHPSLPASERDRHLAEIYVLAEANWLRTQPTVARAIQERNLQIHAFVFDKQKEACVRLVDVSENEIEIRLPSASTKTVVDIDVNAVSAEKKCDGACGGLGLCKKAKENREVYAF